MSPVGLLVLLAAGALVAWVLGGTILRLGGWVLMIGGAVGLVSGPGLEALGLLVVGSVMWLVGHRHHALRHGFDKSPLASRVLRRGRGAGA